MSSVKQLLQLLLNIINFIVSIFSKYLLRTSSGSGTSIANKWAAWISVDPRSGDINVYPQDAASRLEVAKLAGQDVVRLGPTFFDATVTLQDFPIQRTARGSRDVRRIDLVTPDDMISLDVFHGQRGWRAADKADSSAPSDTRSVPPPSGAVIEVASLQDAVRRGLSWNDIFGRGPDVCPPKADAGDEAGFLPVWEWCLEVGPSVSAGLHGPEAWGVYSAEQNDLLEDKYRAGEESVEVSVGVRGYKILFGPEPGLARQIDEVLHKRRLVRRRLVTPEERRCLLQPTAPEVSRPEDGCAICCADFAETASMPVVELPGCYHAFHQACVQQLADTGQPCPCCRRDVDWASLGLLNGRLRQRR